MEISSCPSHGQEKAKDINHLCCGVIGFADSETEAVTLYRVGRVSCGLHYIFFTDKVGVLHQHYL